MFYKVMKDGNILDLLGHVTFVRYQEKNRIMIACDKSVAQAIFSSDGTKIWHVYGLYRLPIDGYETVELVEIDQHEYERLNALAKSSIPQ